MGMEIRKPILVADAVKSVMEYAKYGTQETIDFAEADGRRLAEPLIATNDVPSFDKSPYDGFAFSSKDTVNASTINPVQFEVMERVGAGELPTLKLKSGQASRIMTGAKIPEGADCVAMFEVCKSFEQNGKNYMEIKRTMQAGQNVMPVGSELTTGTALAEAGSLINPGMKAVLATFGYHKVKVATKPVVGIIATGTELLDIDEPLQPGKIRNSNGYMVAAQAKRAGAEYKYYGKLADELEPSYKLVKQALEETDLLITTGGVSVGDFDLMPEIFKRLGAKVLFNKVAMRPGSVTTVAVKEGKLLFGLSGNPSACYVGFELFVRPVIQKALFNDNCYHKQASAVMKDDFLKPNPFTRFVRSYIDYDEQGLSVHLSGMDKSNVVSSLAGANSFMVLPGGTRGYKVGDQVNVLLLEEMKGQSKFLL